MTPPCTCKKTHPSECPKHKDAKTYAQSLGITKVKRG